MKIPHMILAILVLVFIGQTVYFYPQLPETIASHFNASGQANGFMSKSSFFLFEGILGAFLVAVSLSIEPMLLRLPDSMINMPNKEYWLAPERRSETLAYFGMFFAWLSTVVIALFIAINQITLTANVLKKDPDSTRMWILVVVFLVLLVGMIAMNLKRFLGRPTA